MTVKRKALREAAQLEWRNGHAVSTDYDDPYYSIESGLDETRHVFIDGNHLADRWRDSPTDRFCILETGLGTGLNFLATASLWANTPDSERPDSLLFMSIENAPLTKEDATRALEPWRSRLPHTDEFLNQLPPRACGHYTLDFEDGAIKLVMLIGDVLDTLNELDEGTLRFDAVFLDGFSPARNPQMWRYPVLDRIADLSAPGTTLATFSAAGELRRNLTRAGFDVSRTPGFGRKREMISAVRTDAETATRRDRAPWFARPSPSCAERVAVIGAGLAGAAAARSLADRGIAVTVYETGNAPGKATSAVPWAGWHPHFALDFNLRSQFMLHGFLATENFARLNPAEATTWRDACGVLFVADRNDRIERLNAIAARLGAAGFDTQFVSSDEASRLSGTRLLHPALASNMGGCISTADLIRCQLSHENISLQLNRSIENITSSHSGVALHDGHRDESFDAVVVATGGNDALSNSLGVDCIDAIRGQVTLVQGPALEGLQRLVCFKGYVTRPNSAGHYVTGATFEHEGDRYSESPLADSDDENLRGLNAVLPGSYSVEGSWVGWRHVARDRLPLVGALPDYSWYRETLGPWTQGGAPGPCPQPRQVPGVYLSVGHASRGTGSAIISGELVAAHITGDYLPLPRPLVHSVHPARFVIRDLRGSRDPVYA